MKDKVKALLNFILGRKEKNSLVISANTQKDREMIELEDKAKAKILQVIEEMKDAGGNISTKFLAIGREEVVIASTEYKGGYLVLILKIDGSWTVISTRGNNYRLINPDLDRILKEYTKIADPGFNENVGDLDQYDDYEDYQKKCRVYIEKNKLTLLTKFIESLDKVIQDIRFSSRI